MHSRCFRSGKAGGFIVLGLFSVSLLLVIPALKWSFAPAPKASVPTQFVFADRGTPENGDGRPDQPAELEVREWHYVESLGVELAQFNTVFWEPEDTLSLRQRIQESPDVPGSRVLEIGTGTGLIAIACLLADADQVVATDINGRACANASYNAEQLQLDSDLDVRQVPPERPGPFSVIGADEQFDLIISNPPWEDADVAEVAAYALYDPQFELLDGLLEQSAAHLRPDGRLWLAYGAKTAIERILRTAPELGWQVDVLDPRDLDDLPEVFLPGVLLELRRK